TAVAAIATRAWLSRSSSTSRSAASTWRSSGWRRNLPAAADLKRPLVESEHPLLSIRRQCELPDLNRSSYCDRLVQPVRALVAAVEHAGRGLLLGGAGRGVVAGPEIFNTDLGSQFTSREYTGRLEGAGIAVSRDGRGRALDNVFVERLRRSVKYEDIYIKDYDHVTELESGLTAYFQIYYTYRPHHSLHYPT